MAHANTQSNDAHGDHPLVGHLVPMWLLMLIGTTLLVLTVITVAVRYIDVGEFNMVIALGVAVVKATLVALFFMHLRWDRPFNLMVLVGSMLFVVLMMVFCMMDVGQNMPSENTGNPKNVQTYLDANAPFAPVTSKK